MLSAEFGIDNKGRSLSCFLNSALQALWVFPIVRMNLLEFCEQRKDSEDEPDKEHLNTFIAALKEFFSEVGQ